MCHWGAAEVHLSFNLFALIPVASALPLSLLFALALSLSREREGERESALFQRGALLNTRNQSDDNE